jgi:RNA polymerase sigma-70 factor (ECF subfamily)
MTSANQNANYQDDFLRMRPRLFALAYKMTKSVVDAEDIIQETFLAIGSLKPGTIKTPEAYLVRVVTNRCLSVLDQRKATYYPGPDLPEPLEDGFVPEATGQDLSYGLLLLLKRLKPAERAVFLLRESFDFEYDLIAEIVETSPDNCRQMLHRAKDKLRQLQPLRATLAH